MTARPRRSRRAGFTLIEMLIGVSLIVMITTAVLNLGVVAARTASRSRVRTTNSAHARATLDEVLRQTRAASQVLTSASVAGATVATGDTNLVLQTPSYDAGSAGVLLASKTDTVAFRFDAQAKTITQSTAPAVGSQCPVRSALVVARNVSAVAYTYYAQDEFTGDGTTSAFVLSAKVKTGLVPTAYVNGVPTACTYTTATRAAALVSPPASGANVQFLYVLDPATDGGVWTSHTDRVDVTLTLTDTDGRNTVVSTTLSGSARLRNRRT
jgi:prepilin-type N-terminal cleavage/methylation domain-containing protein